MKVDWNKVVEKFGWRFIPSHDVSTEFGLNAVPDCWYHEYLGERVFSIEEVIVLIFRHLQGCI